MVGDEKESYGAGLPRFGWRTNPLSASLRAVHPQAPAWKMLEDDVITNCHCRLGMAKSSVCQECCVYMSLVTSFKCIDE
jgi:hypothetical protein